MYNTYYNSYDVCIDLSIYRAIARLGNVVLGDVGCGCGCFRPKVYGSAERRNSALSLGSASKLLWAFDHFYRSLHLERMVKTFINPPKPPASTAGC